MWLSLDHDGFRLPWILSACFGLPIHPGLCCIFSIFAILAAHSVHHQRHSSLSPPCRRSHVLLPHRRYCDAIHHLHSSPPSPPLPSLLPPPLLSLQPAASHCPQPQRPLNRPANSVSVQEGSTSPVVAFPPLLPSSPSLYPPSFRLCRCFCHHLRLHIHYHHHLPSPLPWTPPSSPLSLPASPLPLP